MTKLKKMASVGLSTTRVILQATIPTISGISGTTLIRAVPAGTAGSIEDEISLLLSAINLCVTLLSLNDLAKAVSSNDRHQYATLTRKEWCLLGVLSLLSIVGFAYSVNRFGVEYNNRAAGFSNAAAVLLNGISAIYLSHRFDRDGVEQHVRLADGPEEAESSLTGSNDGGVGQAQSSSTVTESDGVRYHTGCAP